MEIIYKRDIFEKEDTTGKLYNPEGDVLCFFLEDQVRARGDKKVYAETAIPTGRYEIVVTWSPRFKQRMPLLKNVPRFTGIRIHNGVHEGHSAGCLLTGTRRGRLPDGRQKMLESRSAYRFLLGWIDKVLEVERLFITVEGEKP